MNKSCAQSERPSLIDLADDYDTLRETIAVLSDIPLLNDHLDDQAAIGSLTSLMTIGRWSQ